MPVTTASFSPSGADTFESFSPNSWTACLRRSSATSREPSGWTGPTENTNDSCPPPQHAGHSRLSASFPWCGGQSSSQSRCKRFRGSDQPPPPRPTPTKGASSSTRDSVQSSVPSLVSPPPPVTAGLRVARGPEFKKSAVGGLLAPPSPRPQTAGLFLYSLCLDWIGMPLHFIVFLLFSVFGACLAPRELSSRPAAALSNPFAFQHAIAVGPVRSKGFTTLTHSLLGLPVILPSCCPTQNMHRISRHLDCAQQGFSTGKIGTCEIRFVRNTFAASRASLYENGVDGTSRASSHVISFFCEET